MVKKMKKNKKRYSKFFSIAKYTLLSLFVLLIIAFAFRKNIWISISHLSHKNELRFVKEFLFDLNNNEIDKLRKYFLNDRNIKILKLLIQYDNNLQNRNYYIGGIISELYDDKEKKYIKRSDWASIDLYTKENGKKLNWIEIFIIKKNGKYYIDHFQISEHFPRPPNEH